MDYKELRIGSYYMFADYHGISYRKVKQIKQNQFGLMSDYDGVNFEICKPIPLTEEWLIKFGFEKVLISTGNKEEQGFYKDLLIMLRFQVSEIWYACPYGYPIEIERTLHVHQLQNLYFALTGKELTQQTNN